MTLAGKVVLVTGAGSGIGAATARLAAERGAQVIVTDRDGPAAERVAEDLHATALTLDVTDAEQWDHAIEAAVARFGRVDGLVSNAGVASAGIIADFDLDEFRRVTATNVEGAFLGIQRAVAQMRRQSTPARGSIVVVSSVMASIAVPGVASYATTKAALSNMARAIGVELGRKGDMIRVNVVAPGGVLTPMLLNAMPTGFADDPAATADVPLGEYQAPADVAETIAWLLSDESSFMTASVTTVDGGWSLT